MSSSINFHTRHNVVDIVEFGHREPPINQQIQNCGEVIDFLDGTVVNEGPKEKEGIFSLDREP